MKISSIPRIILRPTTAWIAALLVFSVFFFWVGRIARDRLDSSKPLSESGAKQDFLSAKPRLFLQNVRFFWQKEVFIDTDRLVLDAIPKSGDLLLFDEPDSFYLKIRTGEVRISFASLEKLINGRLLAFPESTLRKIRIFPLFHQGVWKLKVTGEVKLVVWVAFEGIANIVLDSESGKILVENESVRALFNPYTKELLNTVGISIEDLLRFPSGKGLVISGNRIYFEPFSVFPNPHVEGVLHKLELNEDHLKISFASEGIAQPKIHSKNFIYVTGGKILIGGIQIHQGRILLQDAQENTPFDFSFVQFKRALADSSIRLAEDGNILMRMPDNGL